MQRLTRYPLLLNQILKYTSEDHADYELIKEANRVAESILSETNERIRENESRERLRVLSQTLYIGDEARVDLTKPTRSLGPRRILKEETLKKARSKSGRRLTVILCNDLLLILEAKDESLYRMPSPLEEVVVRSLRGKDDAAFQIVIAGQDKINVQAASARTSHLWMRAIEEARSTCLAALMNASSSTVNSAHRRSHSSSVNDVTGRRHSRPWSGVPGGV